MNNTLPTGMLHSVFVSAFTEDNTVTEGIQIKNN